MDLKIETKVQRPHVIHQIELLIVCLTCMHIPFHNQNSTYWRVQNSFIRTQCLYLHKYAACSLYKIMNLYNNLTRSLAY